MVSLPIPNARTLAVKLLIGSLSSLIVLFTGMTASVFMRGAAGVDLSKRSQSLVSAISAYETANGHAPPSLAALTPTFLPVVPNTGFGAYPHYVYLVAKTRQSGDWELKVHCPSPGTDVGSFVYLPPKTVKEFFGSSSVHRDWIFFYD